MRTDGQGEVRDAHKAHRRVPPDLDARDDGRATQVLSATLQITAGLQGPRVNALVSSSRHKDTKKNNNPALFIGRAHR